jgi:hypothetical protein
MTMAVDWPLPLFFSGASRSADLFIERRLAVLVGHLEADVADLDAHLKYDPLDAAPDSKITTRRTPCSTMRSA